ncbi:uncharacterized protein LOC119069322 isoform X2 [Bradysia coprophila]|uniref:uncharacterized protein LOC119069322 isoform X2 n=1 Tax=Bradysia coprophila TaxID=38358 RepID=UPI00187DA72B|nr:uncharacterized protein LOC119069322 isoform X2 [Bradysia coprophila]
MRMATMKQILIFIFMLYNQFPINHGHPIPKNDLIDGREFLSIFLNQRHTDSDRHSIATDDDEKARKVTRNASSVAPRQGEKKLLFNDDDMLPESSNYYGYNGLTSTSTLDVRTTSNGVEVTTKRISDEPKDVTDFEDSGKNIVKFITSGSKIVFLEDIPTEADSQTNERFVDDHRNTKTTHSNRDEIKVISVSISSSETRSEGKLSDNGNNSTQSYDDNDNILITEAKKGDFPIEEEKEIKPHEDSAKEGSMRIQRIVSPPKRIQDDAEETFDTLETVIIHDEQYQKEGSARPRSVSHSSLAQITNPDFWNMENISEFRSNRTTKQHVSELAPRYSDGADTYNDRTKSYSEASKVYSVPSKFYSQPSKVYSEPAKVYGRPEKVYSVPSKVYSEPSRVYSEPAKVYSEPSKIYGEPSKFYGQPSKFYANQDQSTTTKPKKVIFNLDKLPYDLLNAPTRDLLTNNHRTENRFSHLTMKIQRNPELTTEKPYFETTTVDYSPTPEQNYEIDETVSVMTNGRQHGVQIPTNSPNVTPPPATSSQDDPDPQVGYVVEGRNFRKYRVEEKTADGFIVGEYGVVSNDDGSLRGVRYTADSDINPNLIYEALMKFLSL